MFLPPGFPRPVAAQSHVKICGLTRVADARLAIELGAAFIGLIFAAESPRRLDIEQAEELLAGLRRNLPGKAIRPIGVFVHEPVAIICEAIDRLGLAAVQLHAARTAEELACIAVPVVQAVQVRGDEDGPAIREAQQRGAVLLDTFVDGQHGGTGKVFDHGLAVPFIQSGAVFIAGGLKPENISRIAERLRQANARPYCFDASSGLESAPGIKDEEKMRRFFEDLRA